MKRQAFPGTRRLLLLQPRDTLKTNSLQADVQVGRGRTGGWARGGLQSVIWWVGVQREQLLWEERLRRRPWAQWQEAVGTG